RDGRDVIVRIGTTAAPDVSRLKVDPPPGVGKVETRAVRGGTEVVLTLAEGAAARNGVADGAVWINLYAEAPAVPSAPRGALEVPVVSHATADKVVLEFHWDQPDGAAVFRRGEAVWVVFDARATLDLAGARALGPVASAHGTAGAGHLALRLAAPRDLSVSAEAQGPLWRVTIGGRAAAVAGVAVDRPADGDAALVARTAGATKAIWLTGPLAGDRFAAVTALGPGEGFADRRSTVEMALLPTARGLAVATVV